MIDAGFWIRVSTEEQDATNQIPDMERFATHNGYSETWRYEVYDTAYKNGGGAEYKEMLKFALEHARQGEFKVLVIWSLDRLTRHGIEDALRIFRQFRERGVTVVSIQEPWLSGNDATTELLLILAAWIAEQESARRSERIKAGLARRKAQGLPVGKQPGAKDTKPRRRSGYVAMWEPGGSRRAG